MLVGEGLDASNSKQVNVLGFFLQAADNQGECITTENGLIDSQSKRLDFGDKITLSCSVTVSTLEEFKQLCTEGRENLKIFD